MPIGFSSIFVCWCLQHPFTPRPSISSNFCFVLFFRGIYWQDALEHPNLRKHPCLRDNAQTSWLSKLRGLGPRESTFRGCDYDIDMNNVVRTPLVCPWPVPGLSVFVSGCQLDMSPALLKEHGFPHFPLAIFWDPDTEKERSKGQDHFEEAPDELQSLSALVA